MTRYRTIVADPPWHYSRFGKFAGGYAGKRRPGDTSTGSTPLPYDSMTIAQIAALPVRDLAEDAAHLYLWTTNRYLPDAYNVARAWGFFPSTVLVWTKAPRGVGLGGAFTVSTEFILFCRRGRLKPLARIDSTWFAWKRPYERSIVHSKKPEGMLDIVEQVSPGPYLELFARRQRFGWDTWGDEALQHVEMNT